MIIRDDVTVKFVNGMTGDHTIVNAAKASLDEFVTVDFVNSPEEMKSKHRGLIGYLMREKHGSPFEHNAMTFYVSAPIMVFREFMRHRHASYNEMSGRYTELPGEFYIPGTDRNLVNSGSSAKPELTPGSEKQYRVMMSCHEAAYAQAWKSYNTMLDEGIAAEVARNVLPVGLYSKMFVTMNLRGIFNFLSLRVMDKNAVHVSRPQREIEMVAQEMEEFVKEAFPVAHEHFVKNGRVAP